MWSAIRCVLAVVATAAVAFIFPATAPAQARWLKLAPFPEPNQELYGIAANGKMYVLGGFGANGAPAGMVYEYDLASDRWSKKKTMPRPVHHQAMAEYHGKIYVFGGLVQPDAGEPGGWQPVDNSWEYDPAADTWKPLAPLPGKRGSAIAAEVGGKVYVIGGATTNPGSKENAIYRTRPARSVGTNQVYDPTTNKWEDRSPMPTARNHAFSGMVDGKIYVIGGRLGTPWITAGPSNTDLVEEYDPATDQWGPQKARMPTPRSGGGSATYEGKIYTAGGEAQTPDMTPAYRSLQAYDAATNTWAILPSMPVPRHGVAAAFLGNRLHLVSGDVASNVAAPDVRLSTASHDGFQLTDH